MARKTFFSTLSITENSWYLPSLGIFFVYVLHLFIINVYDPSLGRIEEYRPPISDFLGVDDFKNREFQSCTVRLER